MSRLVHDEGCDNGEWEQMCTDCRDCVLEGDTLDRINDYMEDYR